MVCKKPFTAHKSFAKCCSKKCNNELVAIRHSEDKVYVGEIVGLISENGKDAVHPDEVIKLTDAKTYLCPKCNKIHKVDYTRIYLKVDRHEKGKPVFKVFALVH